jgi:hypothetical protein
MGGDHPLFDSGQPCFMVPELIIRDTRQYGTTGSPCRVDIRSDEGADIVLKGTSIAG